MHLQPQFAFPPSAAPTLEILIDEFPHLARAVTDHMIGEDWNRRLIDPPTRLLATVASLAAAGNRVQLKVHAAMALNAGVRQDELKEIVYLTAVHAGLHRAIDAAQALSELFAERWEQGQPLN